MNKQNDRTDAQFGHLNIPKLRFSEFAGEWEKKKLGEVATNKSGKYNPENEICSTGFYVIKSKELMPEVLLLLF